MPKTKVVLFKEKDGSVPLLDWFHGIPIKAVDKCRTRLERLQELGHELRRPVADYLRDGIYELRTAYHGVNYRILYFFHGNMAAIVSHGLTKETRTPPNEINRAIERKRKFEENPQEHTYEVVKR